MAAFTCELPESLDVKLTALAESRGVSKSEIVTEAIVAGLEATLKVEEEPPKNLYEALQDGIGVFASGKGDLATNKDYLEGFGR